jgi:hydrogenase maturation factor
LPAKVLEVDETLALAQVEINGQRTEIDVSLVDGVEVGQTLLVHGGVALERVEGGQP